MMVVRSGIPLIFNTDLSLVKPSIPATGINEHNVLLLRKKSPHWEEQWGLSV
jgi:hypothetical protein